MIKVVGSNNSLVSQITLEEDPSPATKLSNGLTNAKWTVLESSSSTIHSQSRNGLVDKRCSSKPVPKPVRKTSSDDLLELSIRAKRTQSIKNAVFDSQPKHLKSSGDGYWGWNGSADSPPEKPRQPQNDNYWTWDPNAAHGSLANPTTGGRLIDTRWSIAGTGTRPSAESALEVSLENLKLKTRPRTPSMPLMMPKRKTSVDQLMNLSNFGRRKGSSTSLARNATFGLPRRHRR